MKKFKCFCAIFIIFCLCFTTVMAETILDYQPNSWYYAANGSATAKISDDNSIELFCDKTVKSNSEVDTTSFEIKGTMFDISFDLTMNGLGEKCCRSVLLRDENEISLELLRVCGNEMIVFKDTAKSIDVQENKEMNFCFSFDLSQKKLVCVTVNQEEVFNGEYFYEDLDLLNAYLRFRNYTTDGSEEPFSMLVENVKVEAENAPPKIEISGIKDGDILKKGDKAEISFKVSDDYGVSKTELLVNGEKVQSYTSTDGTYTLADLDYGKYEITVNSYDVYGKEGAKTVSFFVSGMLTAEKGFEEDFEDINVNGIGSHTTANGIKMMGQSGYYKTINVDGEHGKSLAIGITKVNEGQTSSPWMAMPTGGITTGLRFSCDFYLSQKANDYTIRFKKDGSTEIYAITLNDAMDCQSVTDIPFNDGNWNNLIIDVDIEGLNYSVYLNGSEVAKNIKMNSIDQIDYIRFFGPNKDDVQTYLAVDNVSIQETVSIPYFENVTYTDKVITAKLNKTLYKNGFSKSCVKVTDIYGKELPVASAKCFGDTLEITLLENCAPNMRYMLVLSEDTKISENITIGQPMSISFATEIQGFEVENVLFIDNGTKTIAKIKVVNKENEKKNVYVIGANWKGKIFNNAQTEKYEIGANSESILEFVFDTPAKGEKTEIYVKDALVKGKSLINKIYTTEE